jgi:hypothetical protein
MNKRKGKRKKDFNRGETVGGIMNRPIKDDTMQNYKIMRKLKTSLKKLDTIQSKDILSKPSEFSLIKVRTLRSRVGSKNSFSDLEASRFNIPRF